MSYPNYNPYMIFSTIQERGLAAQYRQEYFMPHKDYKELCAIVHEGNGNPTTLHFPQPNAHWVPKKGWK